MTSRAVQQPSEIAAHEPPIPWFLIPVIARRQAQSHDRNVSIFRTLMAETSRAPLEKAMAGAKTPTLIVWGERDRLCDPAGAEVLHEVLPNSEVRMMRDTGHVPMLENAAASARDYLDFRQRIARIAGR